MAACAGTNCSPTAWPSRAPGRTSPGGTAWWPRSDPRSSPSCATDGPGRGVGVKCGAGRETADEWLLRYPDDASPSHYIGRSGWNRLAIGGAIPDDEILEAVDASYDLVVSKLPKKDRPPS
jgi:hypothetical protein